MTMLISKGHATHFLPVTRSIVNSLSTTLPPKLNLIRSQLHSCLRYQEGLEGHTRYILGTDLPGRQRRLIDGKERESNDEVTPGDNGHKRHRECQPRPHNNNEARAKQTSAIKSRSIQKNQEGHLKTWKKNKQMAN